MPQRGSEDVTSGLWLVQEETKEGFGIPESGFGK